MPDKFGWDNNFGNSRRQLTPKQKQAVVDAFNAKYPVGTTIRVFPGDMRGRLDEVQVAEPGAHILGGHTPVVQVTGGTRADGSPASYGCIGLSHFYDAP